MKVEGLKRMAEAPEKGQLLAYTRKEVIFKSYSSLEEVEKALNDSELLELHLFDKNREYRSILTQSKRFTSDFIEYVEDFAEDESAYSESIELTGGNGKIRMLQHITYEENTGMAAIDSYRLIMEDK